ncbi:MAG: stage III sporulation AC/AD family protein [Eubacterium sp.]|jgi:stage III sporulation protein AD|nr:stage III sporulation AC/AD family protein [Eubacterium sp.]
MNIISLVAIGLIAAVLSIVIKQYKPEFSVYISLAAGVTILAAAVAAITPMLNDISELTESVRISGIYIEVLLKSLAICYISQLAIDVCKDSGETAIAGKLEMASKIAIVAISLPLFNNLVDIVTQLIK